MAEENIKYLCGLVKYLKNKTSHSLSSTYMLKCKSLNGGKNLPGGQFGPRSLCAHCYCDWSSSGFTAKVIPQPRLSRSGRRRLYRAQVKNKSDAEKRINEKLHSNYLERTCNFCGKKTTIPTLKRWKVENKVRNNDVPDLQPEKLQHKSIHTNNVKPVKNVQKQNVHIYSNSVSVFTTTSNTTPTTKENPPKKSTRKKDKFAGLCKEAVLASKKLKQNNDNYKLNLFLKPSTQ